MEHFPKLKLTATLEVSNAKPRLKTVVRNKRITVTSAGDRVVPSSEEQIMIQKL